MPIPFADHDLMEISSMLELYRPQAYSLEDFAQKGDVRANELERKQLVDCITREYSAMTGCLPPGSPDDFTNQELFMMLVNIRSQSEQQMLA